MKRWQSSVMLGFCGAMMMVMSVAQAQEAQPNAQEAQRGAPPAGFVKVACEQAPPGMSCIEAGPFLRGVDKGDENARPAAVVWLSTYYMDQYEVTYKQYQDCVKAGKCEKAGPRYKGYDGPNQPVTGTNWFHAKQYCEAQGKTLPTEAQWEKAARGPDGDLYPWGNEPSTCERAVILDKKLGKMGRSCGVPKPGTEPEKGVVWDVGSKPVGRYGLYDMMGNVQEWTLDWYTKDYATCGEKCAGLDPKGPCDGDETCKGYNKRTLRGGSWFWPAEHATGIHRRASQPGSVPFHHFGFRCAASVEQARVLAKAAAVK